jgi:hypothetical protein
VGVLLSQGLVFSAWGDAKLGTVANVLLALPLVVAVLGVLPSSYPHRYAAAVQDVLQAEAPTPVVTEADLEAVPPVVQKFLSSGSWAWWGSRRAELMRDLGREDSHQPDERVDAPAHGTGEHRRARGARLPDGRDDCTG